MRPASLLPAIWQELRIDEVARHVCLSPSRLAHLFRDQVGINILRWREDQRVIRAKLLLQTTQESIATIGRVVGYDDQLYFPGVSQAGWRQPQRFSPPQPGDQLPGEPFRDRPLIAASR